MQQRIALPAVPRAILEAGYEATTYRRVYDAALAGVFPASQSATGRWSVNREDLPAIAAALGLDQAAIA